VWAGRRHEARVIRQRGVAPDVEVVLHPALGRQPVVVPADRVEHLLAAHALVPRDDVGVAERADVPDVQLPADGQRGSVDGVNLATRRGAVKLVLRPNSPTGETICPRCRQAWACPARGWPCAPAAPGSRCSCNKVSKMLVRGDTAFWGTPHPRWPGIPLPEPSSWALRFLPLGP